MSKKPITYDTVYVRTITDNTKANMEKVQALSENYVIKNAKRANKLIEDMKNKLEKNKPEKKQILFFIKQLKSIIHFYEEITSEKRVESTKNELIGYYNATEKFYNDIDKILENLGMELQQLYTQRNSLSADDNSRENELRKLSLKNQIEFTDKAIEMLKTFKVCYSDLMPTLEKVQKDVNYFVLVIAESAKVYSKAVQAAELSQTITNAFDTLKQLQELNNLSEQITESWQNLKSITEKLSKIQQDFAA